MSPKLALVVLALLAAPPAGQRRPDAGVRDAQPARATCPPAADHQHCVVLTVRPQRHPQFFPTLVKELEKDGLRVSSGEPGQLAVHQTDQEIRQFWRARVVHRMLAASASDGFHCQATLEGVRIPPRYRGRIAGVQVGHQICE